MRRHKSYLDDIPFASLKFDARVQRAMIPARVRKLTREWVLDDVGVITVSKRADGFYVIDGQHRVRAALELGLGDTKVKCHVYTDLTLEEEARKFLSLNDSRLVSAYDKYEIGLVAKDPICLLIQETLTRHGLRIGRAAGDGVIAAIDKVFTLAKQPEVLEEVCVLIKETWGTRSAAMDGLILSAMGMVLGRYNGELDRGVFVTKLGKYRGGPAALLGDAKGWADYRPITVTRAAAEIIVDTYNKGRRGGQLPPL